MIKTFYQRKMKSIVILALVYSLISMVLAVFSAVMFFRTDDVRSAILYAVLFLTAMIFIVLIKVFAWQIINREILKNHIKRLEKRIEALAEQVNSTKS